VTVGGVPPGERRCGVGNFSYAVPLRAAIQ
jgi:hypothetical protein